MSARKPHRPMPRRSISTLFTLQGAKRFDTIIGDEKQIIEMENLLRPFFETNPLSQREVDNPLMFGLIIRIYNEVIYKSSWSTTEDRLLNSLTQMIIGELIKKHNWIMKSGKRLGDDPVYKSHISNSSKYYDVLLNVLSISSNSSNRPIPSRIVPERAASIKTKKGKNKMGVGKDVNTISDLHNQNISPIITDGNSDETVVVKKKKR